MGSMQLLETTYSESPKVDREAGVIAGVKVLGRESSNGRTYSDRALADASKLYESVKVNIDHPDKSHPNAERKFIEGFGELRNCRIDKDGVFADLHYVKAHPHAAVFAEAAERFPKQFGLSHNADGDETNRGGKRIVESISQVRSVDVVGRPATNRGLFESQETTVKKTIREITQAVPTGLNKTLLLEMEGDMGAAVMDAPIEVPADADADGQIDAAFKAAIHKMVDGVLDDSSLDATGKAAKLKAAVQAILKAMDTVNGATKPKQEPTTESKAEGDAKVKAIIESLRPEIELLKTQVGTLTGERDSLKAEKAVRALIESAGREVTDLRMKAVMALSDDPTRKALIETWPSKLDTKRPATSTSVLRESQGNNEGWTKALERQRKAS